MEFTDFIQRFLLPFLTTFCKFLLGILCVTLFIIFFTLTFPVYIYRFVVVQFAKIFRPDLGEILSDISAYLAIDYFSDKAPRANNVLTLVFNGKVPYEEIKEGFLREWITYPKISSYEKFTQYPVHWLGFTFWKKAKDTFKVENHISLLSRKDRVFTDQDLDDALNKFYNTKFPEQQSPWQILVVENYQPENSANGKHCLMIFAWHHCLADGYSVLMALMRGFFKDFTVNQLKVPNIQFPKRSFLNKILFAVTFPFRALLELSNLLAHFFLPTPLKIPDHKKKWQHVCVRAKPISVQDVKSIKNCAGVSYTSVLISAISAAVDKSWNKSPNKICVKSVMCGSPLPMPDRLKTTGLTNYVTTALFKLNVGSFENAIERLKTTHKMLQDNRNSVVPYLIYYYGWFVGNHLHFVSNLFRNKVVGLGLTNFAGVPTEVGKSGRTCTQCYTVAGTLPGELGISVTAVSHGKQIFIQMCAERALMSREEAQNFVKLIDEEIKHLLKIVVNDRMQDYVTNGKKTQ